MNEFNRKDLDFHLPKDGFKGLSKSYIMKAVFNDEIQKKWKPQEGDMIVGSTGNIFFISGQHKLVPELGGNMFFFGGGLCTRKNSCIMDETYAYTMNESGIYYGYGKDGKIEEQWNNYHSGWKDFRFVPYPHETERM